MEEVEVMECEVAHTAWINATATKQPTLVYYFVCVCVCVCVRACVHVCACATVRTREREREREREYGREKRKLMCLSSQTGATASQQSGVDVNI